MTAKKLVENLLPQFFLRRMKSLIAHQLPKKTDRVVFCQLTDVQSNAYEQFLSSEIVELVRRSSERCECNSGNNRGWCCHAVLPGSTTRWQVCLTTHNNVELLDIDTVQGLGVSCHYNAPEAIESSCATHS